VSSVKTGFLTLLLLLSSAGFLRAATLEGRVIDLETKQPVPLAAVFVGTIARAESGADGLFRFEGLPAGEHVIRVEHVGFEPWRRTQRVSDSQPTKISVRLQPRLTTLEPIDVTTARPDPSVPQGKRTMTSMSIRRSAGTVATDPLRAIQAMPGAAAGGGDDFSDRFVIRGGDPEENLILYDGFTLLQPIHLEGFTSVVYDDLIGTVDVYPGALPPRFGDALSSVTTLSAAQPKRKRGYFRYDLGSVALGGENKSKETVVLGAGRFSFYNLLLRRPPNIRHRSFQDLTTKLSFPRGKYETTITAVFSRDRESGNLDRSADAEMIGARFGSKPGPRMGRIGVYHTTRDRTEELKDKNGRSLEKSEADLRRSGLTGEAAWSIGSSLQTRIDAGYQRDTFTGMNEERVSGVVTSVKGDHEGQGGFVSVEGTWSARLVAISAGGRAEKIPFTKSFPVSPYFSLRYRQFERVVPGFGYRIARQSPFPLYENPEVAGLPVDANELLAVAEGRVVPAQAAHFSASCEVQMGGGFVSVVEAYQKRYDHLLAWDDPAGPDSSSVRDDGYGRGVGLELTLRRDVGRVATGWITYSASKTKKREGPSTSLRPADFDRPDMLQFALAMPVKGGTSLSFAYRVSAGRPITPMHAEGNGTMVPGEINSERLPYYRRLDAKLEHKIIGDKRDAFFYIDVLNLFNRKNVVDISQYVYGGEVYQIVSQGVRITPIAGFGVYF
jgi:hypothetical protein